MLDWTGISNKYMKDLRKLKETNSLKVYNTNRPSTTMVAQMSKQFLDVFITDLRLKKKSLLQSLLFGKEYRIRQLANKTELNSLSFIQENWITFFGKYQIRWCFLSGQL